MSSVAGVSDSFINILVMTGNISEEYLCLIFAISNSRLKVQMSRQPGVDDICPKRGHCTLIERTRPQICINYQSSAP